MAAHAAAQIFIDSALFQTAQHIACYHALEKEFSANPLIQIICHAQKKCYLPTLQQDLLHFVAFQPGDNLRKNRYQILEPETIANKTTAEELDIVFLPLLGFDKYGNRLGMGGGYYDRTFAFVTESKIKKPKLIGLAYASQEVEAIPQEPWDIALDAVLTEKKLIHFTDANKRGEFA